MIDDEPKPNDQLAINELRKIIVGEVTWNPRDAIVLFETLIQSLRTTERDAALRRAAEWDELRHRANEAHARGERVFTPEKVEAANKERAQCEKDHQAMEAIRNHRISLRHWFLDTGINCWIAHDEQGKTPGHFRDPADAILALAKKLEAQKEE